MAEHVSFGAWLKQRRKALDLTQTELAEMVGGSRQSVNQILKSFEARGYLALQGREARILNPEALRLRGAR